MTANTTATGLISRLNAERDALKAFVTLLETEQQTLVDGRVEELLALSDRKTQAAQELSQLANARKTSLLAQGAKTDSGGITAWLQAHAANALPAWQDIQQLAERMRQLNNTNGTLIQTRMRHNQQALIVLHNAANSAGALYGRDGQPHIPTSGRTLGSG